MSPFVVVMSDHKHPKYFVAQRMMGKDSFAIICTSHNEYNARQIATALSKTNQVELTRNAKDRVVTLKRKRA